MPDKVQIEILGLSPSQSQGGSSFAVILGEVEGKRRLPIIIGVFEAQAIAIELEHHKPSRPMTHDLFRSFAEGFSFSLEEVFISELQDGIFLSKIIGYHDQERVEIDARPSDAIAIALRFEIPMYAEEQVLGEAGVEIEDSETEDEDILKGQDAGEEEDEDAVPIEERMKDEQTDKLKKRLRKALDDENYELAAHIRDEINRRN